jgi:uncharacterized repeat protein (TIGR03803 family)
MRSLCALFVGLSLTAVAFAQHPFTTPTITQLFSFSCNTNFTSCPNGIEPTLPPIQLADGNLYGVTFWAGQNNANAGGTDWQLTTSGELTALHTFEPGSSGKFAQGENPVLGFAEGTDGNLYGVSESGGAHGAGVFYKLTPSGTFEILYNFCSRTPCTDVSGAIVLGKDGNFYGANAQTVFRLTPQGTWSLVHQLNSTTEGTALTLIQGADGNFYGTGRLSNERGTVFKVTPARHFTLLHVLPQFQPTTSNLVQASDGNFYGAATSGVFQLTPAGGFKIIHLLTLAQGSNPNQLLQASDGNLWGIAISAGISPDRPGTVFALTLAGQFLTGVQFNCAKTGCNPEGIVQGSDGAFYGTAIKGGSAPINPLGTVFKVDAGLPAPLR